MNESARQINLPATQKLHKKQESYNPVTKIIVKKPFKSFNFAVYIFNHLIS
ncbi:MAG: hypothetical protein ACI81W_002506, partial [Saprospiraceae bacterium]